MNRRRFMLGLGALLASGVALGCVPEPTATPRPSAPPTPTKQAGNPTATLLYTVATPKPLASPTASQPVAQPRTAVAPASSGTKQLTILHTNDSQGYIDPCG